MEELSRFRMAISIQSVRITFQYLTVAGKFQYPSWFCQIHSLINLVEGSSIWSGEISARNPKRPVLMPIWGFLCCQPGWLFSERTVSSYTECHVGGKVMTVENL